MSSSIPETFTLESETKSGLTPAQYKMHYYAIFVLQQLQGSGTVLNDFDPFSLSIDFMSDYNPTKFASYIKNKNKNAIVSSPKPNIVESIVNEFYHSEEGTAATSNETIPKKTKKGKTAIPINADAAPVAKKTKKGKKADATVVNDSAASGTEISIVLPDSCTSDSDAAAPVAKKTKKTTKKAIVSTDTIGPVTILDNNIAVDVVITPEQPTENNSSVEPAKKTKKTKTTDAPKKITKNKKSKEESSTLDSAVASSEPAVASSEPVPAVKKTKKIKENTSDIKTDNSVVKKTVKKNKNNLPEIVNDIVNASISSSNNLTKSKVDSEASKEDIEAPKEDIEAPKEEVEAPKEEVEAPKEEAEEEYEEGEVQVTVKYINNVKYLVDSDNNLYDPETLDSVTI